MASGTLVSTYSLASAFSATNLWYLDTNDVGLFGALCPSGTGADCTINWLGFPLSSSFLTAWHTESLKYCLTFNENPAGTRLA